MIFTYCQDLGHIYGCALHFDSYAREPAKRKIRSDMQMGSLARCECIKCFYSRSLFVGGLRATFATDSPWPIRCLNCREITTANYRLRQLVCNQCKSDQVVHMDDSSEWIGDGKITLYDWFGAELPSKRKVMISTQPGPTEKLTLKQQLMRRINGFYWREEPNRVRHKITDGHYLCPQCGTFELRFPPDAQKTELFD